MEYITPEFNITLLDGIGMEKSGLPDPGENGTPIIPW